MFLVATAARAGEHSLRSTAHIIHALLRRLDERRRAHQTFAMLARLDERALHDIGLNRSSIYNASEASARERAGFH